MTFEVQPAALDGYAAQVGRAADDASTAKGYLGQHTVHGGWNGTLIRLVGGAHTRSMQAATATAGKVSDVLYASQGGLSGAANYYRGADALAATRMDASLLGRCAGAATELEQEWMGNGCGPSFADSREPADRLSSVDDVEYSHPFSVLDSLSVSNWALKGFDFVFGFNPLEKASDFFLGDWQAIAKAGVALGRAADALHDLGYNVQGGAIAVRHSWSGVAAETAYEHFTGLADGIASLVDPMRHISRQFDSIAHGVWNTCEAVTGFVKGMIDAAIIAGIAAAAGTVTAETGVGAVVGYGVAALEVARMLYVWAEATEAMNGLYSSVQAAVGLIESQASRLQGAQLPILSGYRAYHHPLVAS